MSILLLFSLVAFFLSSNFDITRQTARDETMAHGTPVRAYRQISLEELAEAIHLVYVRHLSKAAAARYLGVPDATLHQRLGGGAR